MIKKQKEQEFNKKSLNKKIKAAKPQQQYFGNKN